MSQGLHYLRNSSTFYIPPELARLSGLYLLVKPFYPIAGYPLNGVGMNPTCRFYIGCTFTMHAFHYIVEIAFNNDTNFKLPLYLGWSQETLQLDDFLLVCIMFILDAVPLLDM